MRIQKKEMNPSPLTTVFTRLRLRLHRIAYAVVGSDEEAEDVIQETFCRLWSRDSELTSQEEAARLSMVAVRNQAIDSYRRRAGKSDLPVDRIPECEIPGDEPAPCGTEIYDEVLALSRKTLNERQFAVFELHDVKGLPYDEVARTLGMTPENVRMTLSRARKAIREVYRKNNEWL